MTAANPAACNCAHGHEFHNEFFDRGRRIRALEAERDALKVGKAGAMNALGMARSEIASLNRERDALKANCEDYDKANFAQTQEIIALKADLLKFKGGELMALRGWGDTLTERDALRVRVAELETICKGKFTTLGQVLKEAPR